MIAMADKPLPEKKRFGTLCKPGETFKASDGTRYEVQKDGSWRRIKTQVSGVGDQVSGD